MKLILLIPLVVATFYAVVAGLVLAFVATVATGVANIFTDIYRETQKKTS